MDIRTQLNHQQWREFRHCVKEARVHTDPWYEAVEYVGPSKLLDIALWASRASLSKECIVGGNDYEGLESMGSYISNIPDLRDWRFGIETGHWELKPGYFAILEKSGFRGGDQQAVASLLRRFGIDDALIYHILNEVAEEVLGYVLSSSADKAKMIADAVAVGALSPDYKGTLALVRFLTRHVNSLSSQSGPI